MRNLLNKYLTEASLIALTFSLSTDPANATCSAMPTCSELGYTETSCNASAGYKCMKCPFDTTQMMKIDVCQGYPVSGSDCIRSGLGEYEFCPYSTQGDSGRCKYTSCVEKIYAGAGNYDYYELKDGNCVKVASGGGECDGYIPVPASVTHDPLIDLSNSCGNLYKPTCKIGTYWYGQCNMSDLTIGQAIYNNHELVGIVFEVGANYAKVMRTSVNEITHSSGSSFIDMEAFNQYIRHTTNYPEEDKEGNWKSMKASAGSDTVIAALVNSNFGGLSGWRLPTGEEATKFGDGRISTTCYQVSPTDCCAEGFAHGLSIITSSFASDNYEYMSGYSNYTENINTISTPIMPVLTIGTDPNEGPEPIAKCPSFHVGDIYYSDGYCSTTYDPSRTPIGVIVNTGDRLLISLTEENKYWNDGTSTMVDIPDLPNTSNYAANRDGQSNTNKIIDYVLSSGQAHQAAQYCAEMTTGNKTWFLPSYFQLSLSSSGVDVANVINPAITSAGGTAINTSSYYWTSNESMAAARSPYSVKLTSGGTNIYSKNSSKPVRCYTTF